MLLANRIQTAFTEEGQEIPLKGGGVIPINPATSTSGQFGSQFGDGLQCGCFDEVSLSGQPQPFARASFVKPLPSSSGGIDSIAMSRGLAPPTSCQQSIAALPQAVIRNPQQHHVPIPEVVGAFVGQLQSFGQRFATGFKSWAIGYGWINVWRKWCRVRSWRRCCRSWW